MKHSLKTGLLFSLCLAAMMAVSCTTSPTITITPTATGITVQDQLGRTVNIEKAPGKIISIAPSNTEILFALGLGDRVVGVTSFDDYPPEVKQKPVIGSFTTPDVEKIVFQNPDLILAIARHKKEVIPQLEQRGLTVVGTDPTSVRTTLEAIDLVGKATGQETQAASLIGGIQTDIKGITDTTSKLSAAQKPRVLYLTWVDPIWTVGAGNLDDELISLAGGTNMAHDLQGTTTMTLEEIVHDNPEVIIAGIGMGTGADMTLQFALTEPILNATDARRYNRIFSIDLNIAGRAGPRTASVLRQFAEFIHPELFGTASITSK
jgi:iron complex transport system substrate-binding protein